MKNVIFLLCLVLFYACADSAEESSADKWYAGGTLHKSDIVTWREASDKNKLATCADFVANIKKYEDMTLMKEDAKELMNCIDEATISSEVSSSLSTSEVAASCMLLMEVEY